MKKEWKAMKVRNGLRLLTEEAFVELVTSLFYAVEDVVRKHFT